MSPLLRSAPAAALLLAAGLATASPGVFLEAHTSPEVRAAIAAGRDTILIPIGGTEQNGAALVLGKHNARARLLAERIALRLGDALVAPVIAYVPEGRIDPPSGHMGLAGTITVPVDAFERTLESAARSLHRHGFRHVVLLGDHGGYHRSLRKVAERLNGEWKRAAVIVPDGYYRELPHAGAEDASLALALEPALVREAPPGTTESAGRKAVEAIVDDTVNAVRKARRR